MKSRIQNISFLLFLWGVVSCAPETERREVTLYKHHCASCHKAPDIKHLPKDIWKNSVLPDMLARMDLEEMYKDPQHTTTEFRPKIKLSDWTALENYILSLAPGELEVTKLPDHELLTGFSENILQLDTINGAFYSFLDFDENTNQILAGDITGSLLEYNYRTKVGTKIYNGSTPITWYNKLENSEFITEVGILDPSELEQGRVIVKQDADTLTIASGLHRPVHSLVQDLNDDGSLEVVVTEFGNNSGQLSLLSQNDSSKFEKRNLLNLPGTLRTVAKDMNQDGILDLVVLTSQANERVTIFYQKEDLSFEAETVLEFESVYGSSWFELVDYNHDGLDDIITVNGDNADKSYVHKPYHGMRIHLNKGDNTFLESFFYPLNGATRVLAHDFDEDGDVDFGLISTFPDYERAPERSFVYLENRDSENYDFKTMVLEAPNAGRWFLMDKGDVDQDGDMDILLSSFTYVFTPVPERLAQKWAEENTDILILENQLK